MTLGDFIKEEGRTQKYVHSKLVERGVNVNYHHFNRWCKDVHTPQHEYVYAQLAEVLGTEFIKIKLLFKKNKLV
tara:strand:+ start:3501 stop:3722 length:222 start_codon:yes stop_codon:yes gene_type:complete